MKKDYEMTTVCKYVELLDQGLTAEAIKIRDAAEKYLLEMQGFRKADFDANLLEQLLA